MYARNDIDGWMLDQELQWLYETAGRMSSVVEIGCWKGRSTHALLSGCPGPVWAVDHWLGSIDERETAHKEATERDIFVDFWANVGHFPNLKFIRSDSVEAARQFADKSVDMVFIDGGHHFKEARADITAWLPKAVRLICGHDYRKHSEAFTGVTRAVDEIFDSVDHGPGSIWFKEINGGINGNHI